MSGSDFGNRSVWKVTGSVLLSHVQLQRVGTGKLLQRERYYIPAITPQVFRKFSKSRLLRAGAQRISGH
jgi:hypothetical protein